MYEIKSLYDNNLVAKTQTLIDFAAAKYNNDKEAIKGKCFVIELDEGTKTSEIKGRVDMKELLENKKYTLDSPIADAEYVLINEVDKGSSGVRNTMLSVMRERALFLGGEVKRCKWTIFAGSCNIMSSDVADAPFWDRFVLKYKAERVALAKLKGVWTNTKKEFYVLIPSTEEICNEKISDFKMEMFAKTIYKDVSDRTISYIPKMTKAIKIIWECADNEAIIKACELIAPNKVSELSKSLEDPRIVELKSMIGQLSGIKDATHLTNFLDDIEQKINTLSTDASIADDILQVKTLLKTSIGKSSTIKKILANKINLNFPNAETVAEEQS